MVGINPLKPDYIPLEKAVQDYHVSESTIRYAHELCPDDLLIVGQSKVDRNSIGLVMPSSFELIEEAGFDITDKFADNLKTMFKRKSIGLFDGLIAAQLKRYWSLCLGDLVEYKPNSISGALLSERGIDYAWKETLNVEYPIKDIKICLERNVLLLEDLMGLYSEYLFAKENECHLWAHYKMNLARKIEDQLCNFYLPKLKTKGEDVEDVRYGLRVALITHRPEKGKFLTYAEGIVKKILPIIANSREIDAARSSMFTAEIADQWVKEHNLSPEFAEKVRESLKNPPEQPYKEPHSDSLDLCRTLYQFEKEPIPVGYKADKADLKKALMTLQGGDRLLIIMYSFENLNWKEMECVFELPTDLLKQIHSALIKKVRRKLADQKSIE